MLSWSWHTVQEENNKKRLQNILHIKSGTITLSPVVVNHRSQGCWCFQVDGSPQETQTNPVSILWIRALTIWWWYTVRHISMWIKGICSSAAYRSDDPWILFSISLWKWRVNMRKAMQRWSCEESYHLNKPYCTLFISMIGNVSYLPT